MHRKTIALGICLGLAPLVHAQLVMNTSMTPTQLVQNVLVGNGVTVFNVSYNGVLDPQSPQLGSGSFTATNSNLGVNAGLILTSGSVVNVANPADFFSSDPLSGYVDNDLSLLGTGTVDDASVLEFDFIPNGDSIKFSYVWGSEEYPEFVCTQFNDVFGFFLSGPGISGGMGFSNDAENIALVPGTSIPVSIGNVNNGNPNDQTCVPQNSQYYVDNTGGTTVVYDGFTTVFQAKHAVTCGAVHHIKLAIADVGDQSYDSGVFLESGSFTTSPFVPSLTPGPGIVGDTLYESCFDVGLTFLREGDSTGVDTVNMIISGTATPGVDYSPPLPSQIIFQPFVTAIPFAMNAPPDADGPETIVITLLTRSPCSDDTIQTSFTFWIDQPDPLIVIGSANQLDCGESIQLTPTITGGYGAFHYDWSVPGSGPSILYTPDHVADVYVNVTDTCGLSAQGYFAVELSQPPPITASLVGPQPLVEGCAPAMLTVQRPAGTSGDLLVDIANTGVAQPPGDYSIPTPVVITGNNSSVTVPVMALEDNTGEGQENVILTASYSNACQQTVSATVSTSIVDATPIELTSDSPLIIPCGSDSVALLAQASGGVGSLDLQWSNGYTGPQAYVTNSLDGTYTVTATDDCGHSKEVEVVVDPQCAIIIPNVISPNGDGENDVFFIQGILATKSSVRIYNRWGQVVFEATNYQNNWAAKDLPDGTYFYEVKVDQEPKPYTGSLTILSNNRR